MTGSSAATPGIWRFTVVQEEPHPNQIRAHMRRLRSLERTRQALLEELARSEPLVRGSLTHILQRCGAPNCHCAAQPAHPVWRLSSSRKGRQRCQLVRQADVAVVREQVARYKAFRKGLRQLAAIEKDQRAILRGILEERDVGYS
jgi:hypothetical protein